MESARELPLSQPEISAQFERAREVPEVNRRYVFQKRHLHKVPS